MGFEEEEKNKLIIKDAIHFIKNLENNKKYDFIFSDCYDEHSTLPEPFVSRFFLKKVLFHLSDDGIFVFHLATYSLTEEKIISYVKNIVEIFPDLYLLDGNLFNFNFLFCLFLIIF